MRLLVRLAFCLTFLPPAMGAPTADQPTPADLAYLSDPGVPFDRRVDRLLKLLTLEEKTSLLECEAPAVERFGIGAFDCWSDALHGVVAMRAFDKGYATVFPQCIALAATWDGELVCRVGEAISVEARAKNHGRGATCFCPDVNIFRDPRWGRGQETWGEDPFLTGQLATAYVRGFQGSDPKYLRNAAIAKYFAVHSGPEEGRSSFNVFPDEHDLLETYLPAFRTLVRDGKVAGIVAANSRLRGVPCMADPMLLTRILRDRWGFGGFVISDPSAAANMIAEHKFVRTHREVAAAALAAGCDITIDGGDLPGAVEAKLVSEEMVDRALRRILIVRFRLGEFDPPGAAPFAKVDDSVIESPEHRALARQAAREAMVLLQNRDHVLPLSKSLRRIAVIGPDGDTCRMGTYAGHSLRTVSPVQGIRAAVGVDVVVEAVPGCGLSKDLASQRALLPSFFSPPNAQPGQHGLRAEYFDNDAFAGQPAVVRVDPNVDFRRDAAGAPTPINSKRCSVRWTGTILVPETGRYSFAIRAAGSARFRLDGRSIIDAAEGRDVAISTGAALLEGGRPHELHMEFVSPRSRGSGPGTVRLGGWGAAWAKATLAQALVAARAADAVVLCLGTNPEADDEGHDRPNLDLPADQMELIEQIQAIGKPTVLVLQNGGAMTIATARDRLPAIIEAWYGGEEMGSALADVLFGDCNPAGRLPVTFYKSVDQLPPFKDYSMVGRTYRYFDGEVLYPFGHGLSYTTFAYGNITAEPQAWDGRSAVRVTVSVTNAGQRDGDEVVQLYVAHPNSTVRVPRRQLAAFRRVTIKAGEAKHVEFVLPPSQLATLGPDLQWGIDPGARISVHVGPNQADGADARIHCVAPERVMIDP